ncbi:MAG: glycosyltransferase family A protein [Desulfobacteraceae bacterium]
MNPTMARIKQDIPWNQPGARNLGAHLVNTEYLSFVDIDHEITLKGLKQAHDKRKDPYTLYRFNRILNGKPHYPHPCSFVISKKAFDLIGGFDEDFSGFRGHDDTMFRFVAKQSLRSDMIDGALILHEVALTKTLDRDNMKNKALLETKKQQLLNGTYRTGNRLRFDWEIVHQAHRKPGRGDMNKWG